MPFADAPYDPHMISLMSAALETACMAINISAPSVLHLDRLKMEKAILAAAGGGQRDFALLQQAAFDAIGVSTTPVDRRQKIRLVEHERRREVDIKCSCVSKS